MRHGSRGGRIATPIALALAGLTVAGTACAFPWSKDMRDQPSVKTQEMPLPLPPGAVPRQGVEVIPDDDALADRFVNPVPRSAGSLARGEKLWLTYCIVCHGRTGQGNGTVTQPGKFIPPPNLNASMTRGRSDGYIYAHIRRGGPIMPSYRYAISAEAAWDLVNHVRRLQATQPSQ